VLGAQLIPLKNT